MKCCASPTTSTAPNSRASRVDAPNPPNALAFFEALLLSTALKPVAKALGFYGEYVVERCAQDVVFREARPRA
jgi:hypothetical protein